jgi:hypothetical protein
LTAGHIAKEDDEVRKALSNPDVVRAMQDPAVQECLNVCRTQPHRIHEFMRNPRVKAGIDALAKAGVVKLM